LSVRAQASSQGNAHQVTQRLLFRLGYSARHSRRDFMIDPIDRQGSSTDGLLLLQNSGRSEYRELQFEARLRLQERRSIFLS
jgi:hypothetical protein